MAASEQVAVKVSAAMARQRFHGCEPEYIRNVCKGACCRHSKRGAVVHVLPGEVPTFTAQGAEIGADGLIKPACGRCPFQAADNLCSIHPAKPYGCAASPFTVNKKNTLIIRNRYRLLRCYRDGPHPAYRAFSGALQRIFGVRVAAEITAHLDAGGGDITVPAPAENIAALRAKNEASYG